MNDIFSALSWFYNLPWYFFVGGFVWFCFVVSRNQIIFLEKMKKDNPEKYNKMLEEYVNKKENRKFWWE